MYLESSRWVPPNFLALRRFLDVFSRRGPVARRLCAVRALVVFAIASSSAPAWATPLGADDPSSTNEIDGSPPRAVPLRSEAAASPGGADTADSPSPSKTPRQGIWVGGRIGLLAFGGNFFQFQLPGRPPEFETAGNLVRPGLGAEVDGGFRFLRRYIPYVFYEHGLLGAGRRLSDRASARSHFAGLGFRTLFAEFDPWSLVADLSLGYRWVEVSDDTGTYRMSTLELFRVGLGVDVRLSSRVSLSPMISVTTGSMQSATGTIAYPSTPSVNAPYFREGADISDTRTYIVAALSVGLHMDFFAGGWFARGPEGAAKVSGVGTPRVKAAR